MPATVQDPRTGKKVSHYVCPTGVNRGAQREKRRVMKQLAAAPNRDYYEGRQTEAGLLQEAHSGDSDSAAKEIMGLRRDEAEDDDGGVNLGVEG